MALTESRMFPLGSPAPDFTLLEPASGNHLPLSSLKGEKGTVVVFMSNHCPFVKHILTGLVDLATEYKNKGIGFVAINSNDVANYPEDSPEKMAEVARQMAFSFPYLFDETQAVAKAYQAACTPDFYLFDQALRCVYRGRMDESRPNNQTPVSGKDLRSALDNLLALKEICGTQYPSIGCNIKWKEG